MMGLHPCYVKENYKNELNTVAEWLDKNQFFAVGEIGLDYYWDETFVPQQKDAFNVQMDLALQHNLPIVIHTRDSMDDGISMVQKKQNGSLKGIFHCFGGTIDQAKAIIDVGFYLGIGGVATFKKSSLQETLKQIPLSHIVLETDAPYLAPVPYRGKRNESSFIPLIAQMIADIKQCSITEVEKTTTDNANKIFDK
jgi:TatD DNase family protein